MSTVTYDNARANLATLLDEVASTREAVVIQRAGHPDVAMLPADELSSLMETAHLLRSPRNAERLLSALDRAHKDGGVPMTIEELRAQAGDDGTRR